MSVLINSYPVLTPDIFQRIGYMPSEYQYSYSSMDGSYPLSAEPVAFREEVIKLIDERCEWTPDTHNIEVSRDIRICIPVHLFGKNGLVPSNAMIGVAVEWTSKSSNQRNVVKVGAFTRNTAVPTLHFAHRFNAGQMCGSFVLNTLLYVEKAGVPSKDEVHLANTEGMVLGALDAACVIIDGNGSVFPIVEVNVPAQPLWWVKCNWTDPLIDLFDEDNIQICLNSAHPDFGLLQIKSGVKESPILREVLASALAIIIQKVKDSEFWEDTIKGKNMTDGSISQAVHYFLTTFEWHHQTPELLATSIRQDFDKRFR